jgi:hypothetical protein
MTKCEQETIIRWDAGSDVVHVWTAHKSIANRLKKLGCKPADDRAQDGTVVSWYCQIESSKFKWGVRRGKRVMSDVQREALSKRLAAAREKK